MMSCGRIRLLFSRDKLDEGWKGQRPRPPDVWADGGNAGDAIAAADKTTLKISSAKATIFPKLSEEENDCPNYLLFRSEQPSRMERALL
ncbi:hypothetical protein CEXT_677791 [Caerostris extrusa]|uniref:Uncharacterized protein n=1 Tax=Caerostris extrusa TaxID=172846 RepID=A0AAV4N2N6_CAEEX|nr:hypothetical protein CEXT_677791 [Caerostris extrusa]